MTEPVLATAPVTRPKASRPAARRSAARPQAKPAAAVTQRVTPSAKTKPVRRNRRNDVGGGDVFYVPPHLIPRGYTVEWKRISTLNKEEDDSYFVDLADQGWEAATVAQFPDLVSKNYTGKSIIRKGMMLMIRPKELTEEARAEDLQAAREQVKDKLAALGRADKGEFKRKVQAVKRTYERPTVEDDDGLETGE